MMEMLWDNVASKLPIKNIRMSNDTPTGLFINKSMPNVHMLLRVNDVVMANDQIGRLQHQLRVVSELCSKYGLGINMSEQMFLL